MATFRTYAEALRPDHPLMKIHKAASHVAPQQVPARRNRPGHAR